jgi:sugar phosphate isomerase/epimerase
MVAQPDGLKYSVTSVILPDLSVAETCQLLQKLGYDGVEWRVRYTRPNAVGKGYSYWGEHKTDLSPANLAEKAREVSRITADHGLEIAAIASNLRTDEYEEIKRLADGVARLGKIPVRLGAPRGYDRSAPYGVLYDEAVEAYGRAIEILKPYGITSIIEIHGGTIMVSASLAYRIASNFSTEEMGVIYDVNNMAKDGFETFRIGLELLGDYLLHCHAGGWRPVEGGRLADGTLDWKWEGCDLSDSILDIPLFLSDLLAVRYRGFISIEDFRPIPHKDKLGRQIAYLRGIERRLAGD